MKYHEIIETLKRLNVKPRHQLGQNFLVNEMYAELIVSALNIQPGDRVLEIGSGLGALSSLLIGPIHSTTLVEYDHVFAAELEKKYHLQKVEILPVDILKTDVSKYNKIIGNLPYYITTPIIKKVLLENMQLETFVFLIQKEVGQKLLAPAGSKDYGPLQILMHYLGKLTYLKEIKPQNFYPIPHVDSVVMRLEINPNTNHQFKTFLYQSLLPLFTHNRKMLKNNIQGHSLKEQIVTQLTALGLSLNKRPQEIKAEDYLKIFQSIFLSIASSL